MVLWKPKNISLYTKFNRISLDINIQAQASVLSFHTARRSISNGYYAMSQSPVGLHSAADGTLSFPIQLFRSDRQDSHIFQFNLLKFYFISMRLSALAVIAAGAALGESIEFLIQSMP